MGQIYVCKAQEEKSKEKGKEQLKQIPPIKNE